MPSVEPRALASGIQKTTSFMRLIDCARPLPQAVLTFHCTSPVRRTSTNFNRHCFHANLANASPAGFAVDDSHGADDSVTAFHLLACFRNFKIQFRQTEAMMKEEQLNELLYQALKLSWEVCRSTRLPFARHQ